MTKARNGAGRAVDGALVVTNRLPYPLDDGWKRRTFHLTRAVGRNRPVTLVSLHEGGPDSPRELEAALGIDVEVRWVPPPPLRSATAALLGAVTPVPYHVWRQRSRALRQLILSQADRRTFGVAVATLAHLDPYLQLVDAFRVVDTHNIDSLVLRRYASSLRGPKSWYARMTARRLESHEIRVFTDADLVLVCSNDERRRVRQMVPRANVETIPNGVDSLTEFSPPDAEPCDDIVFFGRLDYYPNDDAVRWFVDSVLPFIRSREPETRVTIIGPGASPDLTSLADRWPNLRFAGRVDDLRETVGRARVVVVPLRVGGGTRLKILEALALERPVVSTRIGAEGLHLESGTELLLADEPREFADAVIRLLRDPSGARRLGTAGRAAVVAAYDWSIIEDRLSALLDASIAAPRT